MSDEDKGVEEEKRSPLHPPQLAAAADSDEELAAEKLSDDSDDSLGGDGCGVLTPEEEEILERRRCAELALVDRFDKTKIDPRKECWFLISSKWMRQWIDYVTGKNEPPGPISNMDLHVEGTRTLKEGLQPKIDFRAISPTMWYIFVELYNRDGAPDAAGARL